jgi:hypothetical protein
VVVGVLEALLAVMYLGLVVQRLAQPLKFSLLLLVLHTLMQSELLELVAMVLPQLMVQTEETQLSLLAQQRLQVVVGKAQQLVNTGVRKMAALLQMEI